MACSLPYRDGSMAHLLAYRRRLKWLARSHIATAQWLNHSIAHAGSIANCRAFPEVHVVQRATSGHSWFGWAVKSSEGRRGDCFFGFFSYRIFLFFWCFICLPPPPSLSSIWMTLTSLSPLCSTRPPGTPILNCVCPISPPYPPAPSTTLASLRIPLKNQLCTPNFPFCALS